MLLLATFATLVIELGAGLLLALPRSNGCLAHLVRLGALLLAVAAPLLLIWGRVSAGWLAYPLLILACWLSLTTVALAAAGWQAILHRQGGHATDAVDLSLFDPAAYFHVDASSHGSASLGDLVIPLVVGLISSLIWLGLLVPKVISTYLLPDFGTLLRRAGRVALSFSYAVALHVAVALLLGFSFSSPSESSPMIAFTPLSAGSSLPVADLPQHLDGLWQQLDRPRTAAGQPPVSWRPAYTPWLPDQWPPASTTVWVHYAYAYGQDLDLVDGVRVAPPWARVELSAASPLATVVPLRAALEPFTSQGVRPLDAETQTALSRQAEVSAYCLGLTALPDRGQPETAAMRAYYRAWLDNNGAIASLIQPHHAAFLQWLAE